MIEQTTKSGRPAKLKARGRLRQADSAESTEPAMQALRGPVNWGAEKTKRTIDNPHNTRKTLLSKSPWKNPLVSDKPMEAALKSRLLSLFLFMIVLALAGLCSASVLSDTLSNARKQGKIVMLEIGSTGCIPCEEMEPVLEKLRKNYTGKLEVLVVDVRWDRETPRLLGVRTIPTQIFIDKNGKEFHRHMGFYSYENIAALLKKNGL
jgi:thioredoxin 1